jgi:hypothetical protein
MNKRITFFISMMMVLLLVACGDNDADQTQGLVVSNASGQNNFQGEMPLESKLLTGSLLLEGTDIAISSGQAQDLLPLWKLYKSLMESDTAANAEIDAVMNSIQDAMTPEQIAYIDDVQFGAEEMSKMMEDLGISFGVSGNKGEEVVGIPSGPMSGEFMISPAGGQGPGGGQGGAAMGGPEGGFQNLSPEQQETAQAMREERGSGGRGFFFQDTAFVDALIELLEGKLE